MVPRSRGPALVTTRLVVRLAWRDLRGSGPALRVVFACLALGVTLVAASGGLFRQVSDALLADTRALYGGDLEVRGRTPLAPDVLGWMRARGAVSLLVELRTMLMTADGRFQLVELQSFDEHYPLYGSVALAPAAPLESALGRRGDRWGTALDPVLAERLGLGVGDQVVLGALAVEVRALIERQPDRSLRADWRGPPVLVAAAALPATGLVQPASRLGYRYRVRTDGDPRAWRSALIAAFPGSDWEVRTFAERSARLAEVLGQLGSGLLLIGFGALFVGGLGVFNSTHAYLRSKLETVATLRCLGLRDGRVAAVYLTQIVMLATAASAVGIALGGGLALAGAAVAAQRLPLAPSVAALAGPLAGAGAFGLLTAVTFALPAVGGAIAVSPGLLLRGTRTADLRTPRAWWWTTGAAAALTATLVAVALPEPTFGLAFVLVIGAVLGALEGLVRTLRALAGRLAAQPLAAGSFALRLALSNLHRRGSPLRACLLSLGSALTVLVASTLVVAALLEALNETIPERAPALALHDVSVGQLAQVRAALEAAPSLQRIELAPLVLGRLARVDGLALRESADAARVLEARDEHKLSYRQNNFDQVQVERGAWWPVDYRGPPLVAMEDREADQLGLQVGDRLTFDIQGTAVVADLVAIYAQRRLEARFWLEAVFTDGILDPFVTRYVGTAYLSEADALAAQARIARVAPNVVTVRTAGILDEARSLLGRASAGLAVVAGVSLAGSLLVLASVVATTRARLLHETALLHALGARIRVLRHSLQLEYAVLAMLTSVFAMVLGGALAAILLEHRLALRTDGLWWLSALAAVTLSTLSLGLGASQGLRRLRVAPAALLRAGQ